MLGTPDCACSPVGLLLGVECSIGCFGIIDL